MSNSFILYVIYGGIQRFSVTFYVISAFGEANSSLSIFVILEVDRLVNGGHVCYGIINMRHDTLKIINS